MTSQGTIYVTDGVSVWYPKWVDNMNIWLEIEGKHYRESLKYRTEMVENAIERIIKRHESERG